MIEPTDPALFSSCVGIALIENCNLTTVELEEQPQSRLLRWLLGPQLVEVVCPDLRVVRAGNTYVVHPAVARILRSFITDPDFSSVQKR